MPLLTSPPVSHSSHPILPERRESVNVGTIGSSFLGIMSTMAGAGILALPAAFARTGILWALFLLIMMGGITYASVYYLCLTANLTDEYSYEGLSDRLLGPWGRLSTQGLTLILLFGACVMYFVIAMDLLAPMFFSSGGRSHVALLFFLLSIPLCLPESIYALRYSNALVMGCLLFIALAVLIRTLGDDDWSVAPVTMLPPRKESMMSSMYNLSKAIPVHGLAFGCQINGLRAYGELKIKDEMRMVNFLVVTLGCAFYAAFALLGYVCFSGTPPDDLLTGFATTDRLMNGARMALAACMLFKTPIVFQPFRQMIERTCGRTTTAPMQHGSLIRLAETVFFLALMGIMAISSSDLTHVMDVLGALAALYIAFSVPGLFLWQASYGVLDGQNLEPLRRPAAGLIAAGVVLTALSIQGVF